MKKSDRIAALVESLRNERENAEEPCYTEYFACFNERRYYEAHDVLEHLWLKRGVEDADYAFFKGLIQLAGAFVHLKKQFARPEHPTDGRRMRPASRLFKLAAANLAAYRPTHLRLDVEAVHGFCLAQAERIEAADYLVNPWNPEEAPELSLGTFENGEP